MPLSRKGGGGFAKLIKVIKFSTNYNAAKLELSMQSSSANLLYLFIGGEDSLVDTIGGGGGGVVQ